MSHRCGCGPQGWRPGALVSQERGTWTAGTGYRGTWTACTGYRERMIREPVARNDAAAPDAVTFTLCVPQPIRCDRVEASRDHCYRSACGSASAPSRSFLAWRSAALVEFLLEIGHNRSLSLRSERAPRKGSKPYASGSGCPGQHLAHPAEGLRWLRGRRMSAAVRRLAGLAEWCKCGQSAWSR